MIRVNYVKSSRRSALNHGSGDPVLEFEIRAGPSSRLDREGRVSGVREIKFMRQCVIESLAACTSLKTKGTEIPDLS